MKAIVLTRFGPPDALQLQEVKKPVPKGDEVLIRIRATTVFAGDCELRGLRVPLELRLPLWIYLRFFGPKPIILGQELAGEIEAIGQDVRQFRVGDLVFAATGFSMGAYAQYKCLPAEPRSMGGTLATKPANLTHADSPGQPRAVPSVSSAMDRGGRQTRHSWHRRPESRGPGVP